MIGTFGEYVESLKLPAPVLPRIDLAYERCAKLCPEKLTGIFVSEYIADNGQRTVESVAFYSESFWLEADPLLSSDNIHVLPLGNNIQQIDVAPHNYDLKKATDASRFSVTYSFRAIGSLGSDWVLKASQDNCDTLRDVLVKVLIPNLDR